MRLEHLKPKVAQLIKHNSANPDQAMTRICELLQQNITHYDWVGFYFAVPAKRELHLRAFAGIPTDHTVIPFGKGICGQVAESNANFVVPDVQAQDNYIACSIHVKAEIVIPLFKNGVNIGQIDIDSNTPNPFDSEDEDFLAWINAQVATIL